MGNSSTSHVNHRTPCVLVVGQTPPPYHGQAMMIQYLLDSDSKEINLLHVRMAYSDSMHEVGRLQWRKIWHLLALIFRIAYMRVTQPVDILYYPPAGPNRVPFYRDVITLLCTRWMFRHTVFHFQAAGLSELFAKLTPCERLLGRWAYSRPSAGIRLSNLATDDVAFVQARLQFVIPNAAPDEALRFSSAVQSRAENSSGPLRILYLGTVCETKGILVLLNACHQLKCRRIPFELEIVGSFQPRNFQQQVEDALLSLGIRQQTQLRGQLINDEKYNAFARADVFCFPSYYESECFPCVLVEAMSFSLPVVSTRWRGIPSIIEQGVTGFLTDIRDVGETARWLQMLANQPELRLQLGQAARQKYLSSFTKGLYQREVARVFTTVVGNAKDTQTSRVSSV